MKQSKLRRRRVIRYAVLYFTLFVVFVAMIAGPVIVGNLELFPAKLYKDLSSESLFNLAQPTGLFHDDTRNETQTGFNGDPDLYTGVGTATTGGAAQTTRARLF
jgi:1,3-beta-glucan synthase